MKFYVAGKTEDIPRVRHVQALVKAHNHRITYDWTVNVEAEGGAALEHKTDPVNVLKYAKADVGGVYYADVVLAVDHPRLYGTLMEVGMGIAWTKQVWLLGNWERFSVFFAIPGVRRVSWGELAALLEEYNPKRIEREAGPSMVFPDNG